MIKDYLVITDNADKQNAIAQRLIEDVTRFANGQYEIFYTPQLLKNMDEEILHYDSTLSVREREILRNRFIYDYWTYGCTVDEEFYFEL